MRLSALATTSSLLILLSQPVWAQDMPLGLEEIPPEQYAAIEEALPPFSGTTLPAAVDLSPFMPPPGNQDPQNSCVAWALAYALKSFHEVQERGWALTNQGQLNRDRVFSPAYIYNQINKGMDSGSNFLEAFQILKDQGVAPLSHTPYQPYDYTSRPTEQAREVAQSYRIASWRTVPTNDIVGIKAQLNQGNPIVIGATVDQSFQELGANVWRDHNYINTGLHAMAVVGYDDARNAFKVINSWGTQWGDGGYGWIDYSFFARAVNYAFLVIDEINSAPATTADSEVEEPWISPSLPYADAQVYITTHYHNIPTPLGMIFKLGGNILLPPGPPSELQIVLQIADRQGNPIPGNWPAFQMPSGQAASAVSFSYPGSNYAQQLWWEVEFPYCATGAPSTSLCVGVNAIPTTTNLLVFPVLYVDGVSGAQATPYNLQVIM